MRRAVLGAASVYYSSNFDGKQMIPVPVLFTRVKWWLNRENALAKLQKLISANNCQIPPSS